MKVTHWILFRVLVHMNHQLNLMQRKLDTLLNASTAVPKEQLKELHSESAKLKAKTDLLKAAIEENKQEGTK